MRYSPWPPLEYKRGNEETRKGRGASELRGTTLPCSPSRRSFRSVLYTAAFALATATSAVAQGPPDAVERFTPGSGQTSGQDGRYYPANILGLPDTASRDSIPSVDPARILSIGLGGEIVLRFDSHAIVDRPGMDFTIFENAFRYRLGARERIYAEPAEVSVSSDGITFIPYPFDSLTLAGCAGVTPTNGDKDPFDASLSGGDSFDLAALGLDSVRWVRIRDVTAIVRDNSEHAFWDPTLTGFDLDAVLSLHGGVAAVRSVEDLPPASARITGANPADGTTRLGLDITRGGLVKVWFVDMLGERLPAIVEQPVEAGRAEISIETATLSSGLWLLLVELDGETLAPLPLRITR